MSRVVSLAVALLVVPACRKQTQPVVVGAGAGFTASCNGDFPSWISSNPPVADSGGDVNPQEPGVQHSFELAQSFPLGIPVFVGNVIDHYNPPQPNTDAPWRAYTNLADATQRTNYLNALKDYIFANMANPGIDFNATKNNEDINNRFWYHVPMMTAAGPLSREPYHGATSERALRPSEQTHWLTSGSTLRAVAVGYYNFLGGYTIGQVFKSATLSQTDATKGRFIDGTLVFKLLFAEYVPSRFHAPTPSPGPADPLLHAPAWWVQDPGAPTSPNVEMRLLQVDIAVKDDHFPATGWTFSTFVYDERMYPAEPNGWKRLVPVGIMWGNDPSVTGTATTTLSQTWLNSYPSLPAAFEGHVGRAGRLIGPVDNPISSCLSCHSTAQVDPAAAGGGSNYNGAVTIIPTTCSDPMDWFRNLTGTTPFGRGLTCPVDTGATGLIALDYSLQLQRGVGAVFGFGRVNPCLGVTLPSSPPNAPVRPPSGAGMEKVHLRAGAKTPSMVKLSKEKIESIIGTAPDEAMRR